MLRKAVVQGNVEGVRCALADVDEATLVVTDGREENVLHVAAKQRHRTSVAVLELLVEAMSEEQVSARMRGGATVIRCLLQGSLAPLDTTADGIALFERVPQAQWLLDVRGVTAALARKMSRPALLETDGLQAPSVYWLCKGNQMAALKEVMDRFSDTISVPLGLGGGTLFSLVIGQGSAWSGSDEDEETLLRMIEGAPEKEMNAKSEVYRMVLKGYPTKAILRVLERKQGGALFDPSQPGVNVLHGIAVTGKEELLDDVMPFVTAAHMGQLGGRPGKTPREVAEEKYEERGEEVYRRIAARLQTFTKSAADA